jgi:hypothetical protein
MRLASRGLRSSLRDQQVDLAVVRVGTAVLHRVEQSLRRIVQVAATLIGRM